MVPEQRGNYNCRISKSDLHYLYLPPERGKCSEDKGGVVVNVIRVPPTLPSPLCYVTGNRKLRLCFLYFANSKINRG